MGGQENSSSIDQVMVNMDTSMGASEQQRTWLWLALIKNYLPVASSQRSNESLTGNLLRALPCFRGGKKTAGTKEVSIFNPLYFSSLFLKWQTAFPLTVFICLQLKNKRRVFVCAGLIQTMFYFSLWRTLQNQSQVHQRHTDTKGAQRRWIFSPEHGDGREDEGQWGKWN